MKISTSNHRPIIGVVPLWDENKGSLWMLPGYFDGIMSAGGVPVMFPLATDDVLIEQLINACDGFLFTGGHDVSPDFYGEEKLPKCGEICIRRDEMETLLFKKAILQYDKPALGICRGIQFFNAISGGTLYQDLPSQRNIHHVQKAPYDTACHKVNILPGTPLFDLIGKHQIEVNSYHHQAVKTLSCQFKAMAVSEDGIIEAMYMPCRTFAWAVQWHPELWLQNEISKKIFNKFIGTCHEMTKADL
jgi:putative glutamine amidotransferase